MKKLFFSLIMFLAFSFNSQSQFVPIREGEQSCAQQAWDFGTRWAGYLGLDAYYWTDYYYTENCL